MFYSVTSGVNVYRRIGYTRIAFLLALLKHVKIRTQIPLKIEEDFDSYCWEVLQLRNTSRKEECGGGGG